MIKQSLVALFILSLILVFSSGTIALAENCFNYYTMDKGNYIINLTDRMESQTENVVKTDRIVNLVVNNSSNEVFKFSIPAMNINIEVPKGTVAVIPVKFFNPNDDDIWFTVRRLKRYDVKPTFELSYQPNFGTSELGRESNAINNDELFKISFYNWSEINNKNKEICTNYKRYTISSEPALTPPEKAVSKVEPAASHKIKTGGYVRGYW